MPAHKYRVIYHTDKLPKKELSVKKDWLLEATGAYTRNTQEHASVIEAEDHILLLGVQEVEKPSRLELTLSVYLIDHPTESRSASDRRDTLIDFFEDFIEEWLGVLPISVTEVKDESLVPA